MHKGRAVVVLPWASGIPGSAIITEFGAEVQMKYDTKQKNTENIHVD
jgi:hypothetical protein